DRYAHWLEHMGRYPSARAQYARALTVGEGAGTRAARLVIEPLLGIARTYRLEATNGNEEEGAQYVDPFAQSGFGMTSDRGPRGLNPDGEKRSEERRVGKECRYGWGGEQEKKKKEEKHKEAELICSIRELRWAYRSVMT